MRVVVGGAEGELVGVRLAERDGARLGEGADLRWALAQLGARLVRSRVDNVLAGNIVGLVGLRDVYVGETLSDTQITPLSR